MDKEAERDLRGKEERRMSQEGKKEKEREEERNKKKLKQRRGMLYGECGR